MKRRLQIDLGHARGETGKRAKPGRKPQRETAFYGNYRNYYGYRKTDDELDPRLTALDPEWLRGGAVLDAGCNIGKVQRPRGPTTRSAQGPPGLARRLCSTGGSQVRIPRCAALEIGGVVT